MHAAVAKRTFGSENVTKHVSFGPLFQHLMSPKLHAAVREKHISKSKCTRYMRCSEHFLRSEVENAQNTTKCFRSTFGSSDVEKLRAAVAKSTFGSENVQNTSVSEHFLKLRCQKNVTPQWRN